MLLICWTKRSSWINILNKPQNIINDLFIFRNGCWLSHQLSTNRLLLLQVLYIKTLHRINPDKMCWMLFNNKPFLSFFAPNIIPSISLSAQTYPTFIHNTRNLWILETTNTIRSIKNIWTFYRRLAFHHHTRIF